MHDEILLLPPKLFIHHLSVCMFAITPPSPYCCGIIMILLLPSQNLTQHSCLLDGHACGFRPQSYQWYIATHDQDELLDETIEEIRRKKIMSGEVSLLGCMEQVRMMSCCLSLKISRLLS